MTDEQKKITGTRDVVKVSSKNVGESTTSLTVHLEDVDSEIDAEDTELSSLVETMLAIRTQLDEAHRKLLTDPESVELKTDVQTLVSNKRIIEEVILQLHYKQ